MIAVLFIILVLCLFIGVPVGFSIGISAMSFLAVSQFTPVTIMAQRLVDGLNSFPLLALPFFILAGEIMSYGCTPRLMRLANLFLGKKPGGLCAAGITASAFFGAISGSAPATTSAIGAVMVPEMEKRNYDKAFTAAVLGGIGSIPGAMVGGLVLGLCESFATGYISSAYEDALAFALLVLILIFRPAGILGKPKVQKV